MEDRSAEMKLPAFIRAFCLHAYGSCSCAVEKNGCGPIVHGRRCAYFDSSVAGNADPAMCADTRERAERQAAVAEYRRMIELGAAPARRCQGAGCREPLPPRARLCPACRVKARKSSVRESQRKRRLNTNMRLEERSAAE